MRGPVGIRVRYLPGYPLSTGTIAGDKAAIQGILRESRADAVPSGVSLPAGVPLLPTFTDMVAV